MNRELAIRKSFYAALSGHISVPVFDGRAENNIDKYVVFDNQSADDNSNFASRSWNCTFDISICHKQKDSYTKDDVDAICEEIENIVLTGKVDTGLSGTEANGWGITNVLLNRVSYMDFKISETSTISIKYLSFTFKLQKL